MAWVITAVAAATATELLIVGGIVASTAVGARGQYISGKAQEIQYKEQAEQEKLAAQSQELARRQDLNRALAANAVSFGGMGIAGEGTPASIALESAKQASASEGAMSLSDKLKQAQLKRAGSNASAMGKLSSASTLLQGATSLAQLGGGE
tara:strand:+ start:7121 stop:7573 length:453 start_codon:yes stop_codon:yes gene_type:complete